MAVEDPFEMGVLTYDLLRSILCEWIKRFSPKMRKMYTRNTSREAPRVGVRGKRLARLTLSTPLVTET